MPALLFLPIGIYCLRKRKFELAVLLLWIGINWFTYLSLEWVDMYARTRLVPWEPRYWMPSLPAITILGGFGIHRLAGRAAERWAGRSRWPDHDKRAARILITGAIVGIIVLWGAVPATSYLQDPDVQIGRPHGLDQAQVVTTDMLLVDPQNYLERPVRLDDVIITGITPQSVSVRSQNSTDVDSVTIRFVDWPTGTLPQFHVGQHVWVQGMFVRPPAPPGGMPSDYFIGVKHGTQDYVRLALPPANSNPQP